MIDDLERDNTAIERELQSAGVDHRYVPLLTTVPGIAWVLGYTIASEIGDVSRFASPTKLAGYTGLCPRVYQSGGCDRRGSLSKRGPRYLRWALLEAATHACTHPRLPRALPAQQGSPRAPARPQGGAGARDHPIMQVDDHRIL